MRATKERKYLKALTVTVEKAIRAIDEEMKKPSTFERGQRISRIMNHLEFQNDLAKRYGLDFKPPAGSPEPQPNKGEKEV